MDDRRFDQFARLFAGSLSRRQTIKTVLGGVLATAAMRARRQAAAAELGCCRCAGSTECQSVQTKADCQAICGPKRREAIYDPYARCVNGACNPATTGDFGCCVCLGDRKKVCANVKNLAVCKEHCKKNADDEPADEDVAFNPNNSCQPGEKKGVYHCMRKSPAAPPSAIACRIDDLGVGTSAMLAAVADEGLLHSGGTVFLTEQAFARVGETAASVAPLIFGDAAALQVRFDQFFAADGTHNVYGYQVQTPGPEQAALLVSGLAAQFARSDAEDVSKNLSGWDENTASRFAFPTEQGKLSRINSFNAVDNLVVWIVDDRYGDRKNSVTLHRKMLEEVPKVRKWFNPDSSADASQATPPGLGLAGLMPIPEGVEQFIWVQTARDGVVVPRYNVDPDETAQTLGGAINAFNGAYGLQRNGVPANVYAAFREFATQEEAEEYVANYERIFAESDAQNGLRRLPDEALQVCLTTSGLRADWRYTVTQPELCEQPTIRELISLTVAHGFLLAWHPVEDVRLVGWAMVVLADILVIDFAWFFLYEGDAETFDTADPASLEGWELGRDSVLQLTNESPAYARYQSPPTGACFPEVPV